MNPHYPRASPPLVPGLICRLLLFAACRQFDGVLVEDAAFPSGVFFGKVNVCWLVVWSCTWSGVATLHGDVGTAVQKSLGVEREQLASRLNG